MIKHFKEYWFPYLYAAFFLAVLVMYAIACVEDDLDEQKCLQKGYYYVDHHCYKQITPAD